MAKQSILVTGASGQLGMELQQLAPSVPEYDFIFLTKEDLSINNSVSVRQTFQQYQPAWCVNCAAYTAVDKAESEKDLAFEINGKAVGVIASVCRDMNCRFIHVSTDYVFDGTASQPYKEDAPVNPRSVYGASKLEGEKQAMQFNPDSIIIRTSWVYSEFGKNFVKTMLRLMKEKEEINVVNDQFGSPTYAADLAEAILQIVRKSVTAQPGIYHYSNDGIITWYQFATAIKEMSGSHCRVNPISTSQYPTPAKRPAYAVMDKARITQTFGIVLKEWKKSLEVCMGRLISKGW